MAQPDSLQSLTVAELKIPLKDAGLAVSGKKAELIARLEEKKVLAEPKSVVQSNEVPSKYISNSIETISTSSNKQSVSSLISVVDHLYS